MKVRLDHDRLARELSRRKLSQNAWAKRIGISRGHLSNLVNGYRPYPSRATQRRLLQALDVAFEDLFEIEPDDLSREAPGRRQLFDLTLLGVRLRAERACSPAGRLQGAAAMLSANGLLNDFSHGFRVAARRPALFATMIGILALGVAASVVIGSVVHAVLLRPLPYEDPTRLVRIYEVFEREDNSQLMGLAETHVFNLRENSQFVDDVTQYQWHQLPVATSGETEKIRVEQVDAFFFPVLGVEPIAGRWFANDEEDEPVAIVGEGFWKSRLDGSGTGQTLHVDGSPFTVVGVMPADFRFPVPEAQIWVPVRFQPREGYHGYGVARLKPDVSLRQVEAEVASLVEDRRIVVKSLLDDTVGDVRRPLLAIGGSIGLLMLIVLTNLATLVVVRTIDRDRELAIRASLGANQGRLMRQVFAENLVWITAATGLGLWIAFASLEMLIANVPVEIARLETTTIDGFSVVLAAACGLLACTALVMTIAARLRGWRLSERLRARSAAAGGFGLVRASLIVGQVAVALVLAVGAGLLAHSLLRLMSVDLAFDAERLLTLKVTLPRDRYPVGEQRRQFWEQLKERLAAHPGVESVSFSSGVPFVSRGGEASFELAGVRVPDGNPVADFQTVDPEHFSTYGLRLEQGRAFQETDLRGPGVVMVNQTLVDRYLNGRSPVGLPLGLAAHDEPFRVIGVYDSFRRQTLDAELRAEFLVLEPQFSWFRSGPGMLQNLWFSNISIRTQSDPSEIVADVAAIARSADSEAEISDLMPMTDRVYLQAATPRFWTLLVGATSLMAVILALVGIHAVMAFSVSRRVSEFGIRLALGASSRRVVRMVVRQGMRLIALGLLFGIAGALALTRVLQGLLFEVEPNDVSTFVVMTAVLLFVGLIGCWLPAARAGRIDPLSAIRSGGE